MMAKGRKLTTSRSELYLGSYGYNQGQGTVMNGSPELEEDDVWSVNYSSNDGHRSATGEWSSRAPTESNGGFIGSYTSNGIPPRADEHQYLPAGGFSFAADDSRDKSAPRGVHQLRLGGESVTESPRGCQVANSAPVNVPDWSKIYRVNSVESLHNWESDDFSDKDSKLIPPHEYVAREGARNRKMAANSVFEGVGRTLKGRDMSRVRDAVWSQTGFNG